ncbi:3-deoxy-D-manno-octulosonic acid transferase [Pseudooceanicola aestuarii]|uniref:3-deoxy-D-manno-octulosonic acid transferase n=1 Tax=Pseudooceanicola aestuarii TaxID=2697319 RepID=UPI0013D26E16|nr:3-deoxy-D-manno-octulosonic acid transferase [Pseudooceanicola aestuarii]
MTSPSRAPAALVLYRLVTAVAGPLAWRRVRAKLLAEGVTTARAAERLGRATLARPDGPVLWFHAASVGESVSVLALADRMLARQPGATGLITSGTSASAQVLARRLPGRCVHQFAPLDTPGAVTRFLAHWRPDAGIFVESEIWPRLLTRADAAGIPLALVNARMSAGSARNWARAGGAARDLLRRYRMIRSQDRTTHDALLRLGADPDRLAEGPNLKAMVPPLPVDQAELSRLRPALPGPVWTAVSTHSGEEEIALAAHLGARAVLPDLQLILVPRHPVRAAEVAALVRARGLSLAQRSRGEDPAGASVYLADTMGETGLWYALADLALVGGSFGPAEGHTPFEPAQLGAPVLHGPRTANFAQVYADFDAAGAALPVADARALSQAIPRLMGDPAARDAMAAAARDLLTRQAAPLDDLAEALIRALDLDPTKGAIARPAAG